MSKTLLRCTDCQLPEYIADGETVCNRCLSHAASKRDLPSREAEEVATLNSRLTALEAELAEARSELSRHQSLLTRATEAIDAANASIAASKAASENTTDAAVGVIRDAGFAIRLIEVVPGHADNTTLVFAAAINPATMQSVEVELRVPTQLSAIHGAYHDIHWQLALACVKALKGGS